MVLHTQRKSCRQLDLIFMTSWNKTENFFTFHCTTRCLKITEKVSFNIASEASYVYILSGQKLIKNAKNGPFLGSFSKPEACGQIVLPDRSLLIRQKLVENAKIKNFKCDILSNFQTMCKGVKSSEMQLIQTSRVARTYFDASFSHLMHYRISTLVVGIDI